MSVNKAILVGRLGKDPETRYTNGGKAVCNFSIATDESWKDSAGERQKATTWHKIVVWGKQAEIAQKYLGKGSLVFVEGRIQMRQWDDRDGKKQTAFEIVASNFRMLGGGKRDEQDQRTPEETAEAQHVPDDNDIPF